VTCGNETISNIDLGITNDMLENGLPIKVPRCQDDAAVVPIRFLGVDPLVPPPPLYFVVVYTSRDCPLFGNAQVWSDCDSSEEWDPNEDCRELP
jgi:hypothetical protein